MIYDPFYIELELCLQLFSLEFLPSLKREFSFYLSFLEKEMPLLGCGGQGSAQLIIEVSRGFLFSNLWKTLSKMYTI